MTAPAAVRAEPVPGRLPQGPWPPKRRGARWLRPGWPLAVLFIGFPLWWMLGLRSFAFLFAVPPMALELARRRKLWAPRGFGLWLLFLVWVVGSLGVIGAAAPGGKTGHLSTRLLSAGYRLSWYVALTVVLLYVANLSESELPARRVCRWLGYMFVVTVLGGYLGMLMPHLQFRSPIEQLVPHGLASNTFFKSLTHPVAAQVQGFLGYAEARPAAPFGHTNDWGANFGLYLPFFVLSWFGPDADWRRRAAPLVLVAAAVPAVYSLNRGLWIGLTALGVYAALRSAATGRFWALGSLLVGGVVIAAAISFTPLGGLLSERIATPHSNDARASLSSLTVKAVVEGSPVVGYGSTRNVVGNFNTIAGGATQDCPRCSPPAMGTQGHFWLLIFSQGFVGAGLFLAFLLRRFFRHWRDHRRLAIAGCAALVFSFVVIWVYDLLDAPLFTVMIALALMWRLEMGGDVSKPAPLPGKLAEVAT